jgi:hypothetical protein
MRGGAQAQLMEAGDGHFYVVKFANNPQSRRILANEWVASALLRHLEIAAPETAVIELSSEFLARNPEVCLQTGSSRREVEPGWHFGSRFPGNPMHLAVYDMLPDALLGKIVNLPSTNGPATPTLARQFSFADALETGCTAAARIRYKSAS